VKRDKEIQEAAVKELECEPDINAADIGVTVKDAVVTLTGRVSTIQEKWTAEKIVRRVAGVRALANDIVVSLSGSDLRSDPAIAHAAANAIESNSSIPMESVQVTVRDGWVTLYGAVPWPYQKVAAEHSVENLYGVKGVANSIVIES
jgi:osmotically-inducible protein OsmY